MKIFRIILIVTLASPISHVFGSEDFYVLPLEVTTQFEGGILSYIKADEGGNLQEVRLLWQGKEFSIPSDELKGINYPNLSSVKVLGGGGLSMGPYRYIAFSFGKKFCNSYNPCPASASFIFGEDGYMQRMVSVPKNIEVNPIVNTAIYTKEPGKAEKPPGRTEGAVYNEKNEH